MVLGLKLMGKPTTYQNQVLDRTKVLPGPRTQTYGETNYSRRILSYLVLGPNTRKRLRLRKLLGRWQNALLFSNLQVLFILGLLGDYFLHGIEHPVITSFKFGAYNPFSGWSFCTQHLQYVHNSIFCL